MTDARKTFKSLPSERYRLAHELYDDLGVILVNCTQLRKLLSEQEKTLQHLHLIEETVRHMTRKIADSF